MKIFFDNCTSPVLASTLDGFVQSRGHSAHHISDLPCGRSAKDIEWMAMLRDSREVWLIITGDGRIQKNRAERVAFRQAKLRGYVLAPGYQKTPINQQAALLIWRWPEMEAFISHVSGGSLFELPMSKSGKFKSLPM